MQPFAKRSPGDELVLSFFINKVGNSVKFQTNAFVNVWAPCCTTSFLVSLNRPPTCFRKAASYVNYTHLGAQSTSRSFSEMETTVQVAGNTGAVIVLMGVSGAGKTTIGSLLAESANCDFLDADDFHPDSNKEKMRKGIPLSEEDRNPWLQVLCNLLKERITAGKFTVLACSALRKKYREILRSSDPYYLPGKLSNAVKFVLLNVPVEVLADRLNNRLSNGKHFMPPSLLKSQLELLEIDTSERILQVDATQNPTDITETIRNCLMQEKVS